MKCSQFLSRLLVSELIETNLSIFHLLTGQQMLFTISNKVSGCIWPDLCQTEAAIKHIISALLAEPGGSLPGSLHDPLVFVLLAWCLALIQDNSLHSRGPQRPTFHFFYLLTNQSGLPAHLSVTEATHDMFLLQVATLWTRLNVVLKEGDREWRLCVKQWNNDTVSKSLLT